MSVTTTFDVIGMTCGHCVAAVRTELGGLPGVEQVEVDLASGAVTVVSAAPLEQADILAAVDEAGYEVAP